MQKKIELINCTETIIKNVLAGNDALAAHLNIQVPDNWTEFGLIAFNYTLEKLRIHPESQPWWTYLPIETTTRTLVGSCGFKGMPNEVGMVEIGYEVAEPFRNQGFATEITRLLVKLAFAKEKVKVVQAHTLGEENPSTSVLKRNGFQLMEEIQSDQDGKIWRWGLRNTNLVNIL